MAYTICKRCVMDTTDPTISFNENGECNLCTEFLQKRIHHNYQGPKSDDQFNLTIQKIKSSGKGKEYDCIVGLSGGVDSSYVAYLCSKHGLRVLAVHLDNGWNAEEAVLNIKNVSRKLDIDYESFVLNWQEFKDLQLSFLKASVPEAETPTDIAIQGALHKIAAKYNIKYIISGGNLATEGILPKFWHYNARDLVYLNFIHKKFGTKKITTIPLFGFLDEIYYKLFKNIKIVYLLNLVSYDKNQTISLLEKELDWKNYNGKHYESIFTGFIQSYYLYKKFGIDYRRATLSSQICTNEISRRDAIEILKSKPYNDEKINTQKEYLAKKFEISLEELDAIITSPPKWYTDYPNDERRLGFIYNLYRWVFRKPKLANF